MADYSNNIIKYSNTSYVVNVTICPDPSMISKNEDSVSFDGQSIEEIYYNSSLNQLVLNGYVICIDKYGRLDKFIEEQQCVCDIMIGEVKRKSDGSFVDGQVNKERCFAQSFIVNSISILQRQTSFIKYKIGLMSINWHQCIANVQYSNNDKDPEPIFDIIKNCICQQNLAIDDETFGKVKANVKMNYISKYNDSWFTLVPYLMHKLFFLPDRDESMKFILYDWFNMKYRLLDMADNTTLVNNITTILSFFKSDAECLIQQEPTNIGSFSSIFGNMQEYKNMFNKDMYAYDIEKNEFVNKNVESKKVVQYMNNNMSYDGYVPKYHEVDSIKTLKYFQSSAYWNAQLNVYNDSLKSIVENGSIVVNMTGDIRVQCGSLINIGLDRDTNALTDDSRAELEKMKTKYKMFEGPWIASSVDNIICPIKQSFRQNVALFRNYMFKKEKPKSIALG